MNRGRADTLIAALAPGDRRVVAAVSVLARLDPLLVAAVTEDTSAFERLSDFGESNRLVIRRGEGYAWLAGAREAAAGELQRSDPTSLPRRHLAAAAALSGDDRYIVDRIRHLIDAQAWELLFATVAGNWQLLVEPDRFDVLADAAAALPLSVVGDSAMYSLGVGVVLLLWGRPVRAEAFLGAEHVRSDPAASATASMLRAHATWWWTPPDVAMAELDRVTEAFERDPDLSPIPLPGFEGITSGGSVLDVCRARACAVAGDVAGAADFLRILDDLPADDPVARSVSAWATKAWVDALAGDLAGAHVATDKAFSFADEGGWRGTMAVAPAHLARALVAARAGSDVPWEDISEAAEIAARANAAALMRTSQAAAAVCGEPGRDLAVADPTGAAASSFADQIVAAWQARVDLRAGDDSRARAVLASVAPHELTLGPWAEVAIAVHGTEVASEMVRSVGPPSTPVGRIVRLLVDAALSTDENDRDASVLAALAACTESGLRGVLRSCPTPAWDAVLRASGGDAVIESISRRYAVGRSPSRPPLSDRELEILRLLDGPLTVQGISAEVYLSKHTAKWYVLRIYRKLGVHNRADAVIRASELGLL